jgi:hypothetical protein
MSDVRINFIKQQGFKAASAQTCAFQYPALMFQPRVTGLLVLAGVLFQAPSLFFALSAVLWWSVLVPRLNPFDRLYHGFIAARQGHPALTPAPHPRRFAQAVAATLMLLIGVSLLADWKMLAWVLEANLLLALAAVIFGAFCVSSFLFHLFTGNGAFARRTLPWRHGA